MNTSVKRIFTITAFILAAAAGVYFYLKPARQAPSPELYTVKIGQVNPYLLVTGNVFPDGYKNLEFELQGKVASVEVKPGDEVKEGQVVATIESDSLNDQLKTAKSNLESARYRYQQTKTTNEYQLKQLKSQLDQAFKQYQNLKGQYEDALKELDELKKSYDLDPSIDLSQQINQLENTVEQLKSQLDQAQYNYEQQLLNYESFKKRSSYDEQMAYVQLKQAQDSLESLNRQADLTSLRAPFDGIVLFVGYRASENIQGSAGISSLASSSGSLQQGSVSGTNQGIIIAPKDYRCYVEANVDQLDIAKIKKGLKVEGALDAYPDIKLSGQVEEVSLFPAQSDASVLSYKVKIILDRTDKVIVPGLSATLKIKLEPERGLIVPVEAVRYINGVPYVYVPDKKGGFRQQQIKTGTSDNNFVIVLSGLTSGDRIVANISEILLTATSGRTPAGSQPSRESGMMFRPGAGQRSR